VAGAGLARRASFRILILAAAIAGLVIAAGSRAAPRGEQVALSVPVLAAEVEQGCAVGLPPGHPPIGTWRALPPGHPPVGVDSTLPAGHPPIPSMGSPEPLQRQLSIVDI
jgi:hypothetical protein